MTVFLLLGQELQLAFSKGSGVLHTLMFFVIAVSLFPFAVGSKAEILSAISIGVIWVAALFASQLSLSSLLQVDYDDGSLEQLLLRNIAPEILVFSKILAHWLTTGVPLVVVSPLLAVLLQWEGEGIGILLLSLSMGTFCFSILSVMGAAMTLGAHKGMAIISIILLPLAIPVLIFGTATFIRSEESVSILLLLLGIMLFMLPVGIIASSVAINMTINEGD